mgnify:CR=1 FL=1
MHEIVNYIVTFVSDMWYGGIFIMMVIESSFFPFPSEVAMIPAWYLASIWKMNFFLAFCFWTFWALIWASINYFLWRYLWARIVKTLIRKYGKYIFISERHYLVSEKYFKNHWSITTFLARFIPAVRQLISLPAWIFKMNYLKFLFYTWVWASIWNLILMYIGYIAWENRELIAEYSREALIWVIILICMIWFIYYQINCAFEEKTENEK